MENLCLNESNINQRLDKFICEVTDLSRNLCQEYIEKGNILVNGKIVKPSYKVQLTDNITIEYEEAKEYEIVPENLHLEYLYNDSDLCVVNKPTGMVVHPANGALEHTLVHGLMYDMGDSLSGINGVMRPGIVHRIDKDTSGLLVVAKSDLAHEGLSKQLENHSMTREYVCLVFGVIKEEAGRVNAPIGRDPEDRLKMTIVADGKPAITNFRVLKRYKSMTLIACKLETGRTHQIRVHMKYIGHPVIGDPLYGPKKMVSETGQYLHAKKLGFIHPRTKEYLEFDSELPEYFKNYLEEIERCE